ncbi:cytochrome P450 [Streptomyces venezuelae]|uniref:Cytochrome P450 n=1 Tax=Streptomyces venezuelae TaxID=54571 RepID=A0A5P2BR69_STRVZ|nr:cytochrome P450 [Streptomyces venezuelae]QES30859.1 cytochrome P450 [Streptomyces venezuelae]
MPKPLDETEQSPLVETTPPGTLDRAWLATGYDEVRAILGDSDRFTTLPPADNIEDSRRLVQPGNLLHYDPPEHTRLRKMLTGEFTLRRVRTLEPLVESIVTERLDAMEGAAHPIDLVPHFVWPTTSLIGCTLLGIPRDDQAELARHLDTNRIDNPDRDQRDAAGNSYLVYLSKFTAQKRRNPGEDLLGRLIQRHGDDLTPAELTGTAATLLASFIQNVGGTLGLGILALLEHPDQLALLKERPELIDHAVEELIRSVSIISHASPRTALEDVTLAGKTVKAGEPVACSLLGANNTNSPGEPTEPIDITRDNSRHMAFGHGIHYCLGAPLTRMELRIAIAELLRRFPGVRLAAPRDELRFTSKAVETLPVAW